MEFVGRTVTKEFKGFGVFTGTVKSYDPSTGLFQVVYEDGDSEELELAEIAALSEAMPAVDQSATSDPTRKRARVGRKPKKRRRIELRGDSGNNSATSVNNTCLEENQKDENLNETVSFGVNLNSSSSYDMGGVNLNDGLDLNDELNLNKGLNLNEDLNLDLNDGFSLNGKNKENLKRISSIDLNLDVNGDYGETPRGADSRSPIVETQKREHCFDLNLGLDDEVNNADAEFNGKMKDNTTFKKMKDNTSSYRTDDTLKEIGGAFMDTQLEDGSRNAIPEEVQVIGVSSDSVLGNSCVESVEGVALGFRCTNETQKGVPCEVSEETPFKGKDASDENVVGDLCVGMGEGNFIEVRDHEYSKDTKPFEGQVKGKLCDAGTPVDNVYQGDSGSTGKGRRKRRKLSHNVTSATKTVLRRSTRRGKATVSAQNDVPNKTLFQEKDDASLSPGCGAALEEKPSISGLEESEERSVLSPKLQLPPSSGNLNLDGIPILDFFSVYACLRSFSTLLYLSPFELEDFGAALKCKAPNLLFDFIHVSLLQTLKKHLESLSDESSQSASNCIRSLNWDLLDVITWPIFMVEYLLMHSSGLKPDFELSRLKLFEIDYYKQPVWVKIEVLRCLCDDVIEVEAIRSELSRRTMTNELNMDSDRTMKIETSKKRRTQMDVSAGSCLTDEVVDETTDWNSDECCLCKMDGSLICCDGCPAAYHSKCVGVASSLLPEGDWYCPECMVGKDKPGMKLGKSLRGAELLGIDPHGRLYYESCGYLLVADSSDTESSFSYYHRSDLTGLAEALKSSDSYYSAILSAISQQWDLSLNFSGGKSDLDFQNVTASSDFLMKGQMPSAPAALPLLLAPSETRVKDETIDEAKLEENSMITQSSGNIGYRVPELVNNEPVTADDFMKMENLLTTSEGSAEISQDITGIQNPQENGPDRLKSSAGIPNDSKILDCGSTPARRKRDALQGQCESIYANCYGFARTASSVAEELTHKSSDKAMKVSTGSVEEIISVQLKAILKNYSKFHWSNIQNLNVDTRKEKCGWCFSCRFPDDDRDCLFSMIDNGPALEGFTSELVGLHSKRNRKGHFVDVLCHILCIEYRLRGLLLGPWLNPHYSKLLLKKVLKASDVTSVKNLLLTLESNLRPLALSPEWLKHVDSVAAMGSASHVVTSSLRLSAKHGIGKKRARCLSTDSNPSSNATTGLVSYWWRGGRLSRQLFNSKVLPRSLASKAARQAGFTKIPGILYPDNSEFAKRSKYVAWRAAVEMSRSVAQLALQVRELDTSIKWDEIENTRLLSVMDNESRKSIRSFKKAIVRRKGMEGTMLKYLLDFGKRRFIPDIVVRHGSMLEESSSGRKKYWVEESHVPLHLLKAFEERTIGRKSSKMSSKKLFEGGRVEKTTTKKRGFSYLFSKAERSENYQCGHCNKDVLIREAVCCQYCKGFFHKRHVRKSGGAITADCTYTCHKCQNNNCMKIDAKKGKSQLQKIKKSSTVRRVLRSNISKKACKDTQAAQSQKNRKDSVVVVSLRRSARKAAFVSLQSKNLEGQKKGKQMKAPRWKKGKRKSRKGTSKKPKIVAWQKKRTRMYHTYWLNGLRLSRKPNDERVIQFRSKKLIDPSDKLSAILDQPKCSLCCERGFTSTLNYIGCESCGDWFHGDAFGLSGDNIGNLIGFKCHKCRNGTAPVCPHLDGIRSDEAQLGEVKNVEDIECPEEISDIIMPSKEVFLKQKSELDGELKFHLIDESSHKEQQLGNTPISNQTIILDAENGHLPISEEQNTQAFKDSDEMDLGPDVLLRSTESILLEENNTTEVGEGHVVTASPLVETKPLPSKSDVDVIDPDLASLCHNNANNSSVKTTGIMGSVVNKSLIGSCELPPQTVLHSGEPLDGGE